MKKLLLSILITGLTLNVQAEMKTVSTENTSPKAEVIALMDAIVGEHSNGKETECNDVDVVELEDGSGYRINDGRWANKLYTSILFKNAKISISSDSTTISGTSVDSTCLIGCVPFTQTEKTKLTVDKDGKLVALEVSEKTSGELRTTICKF